MKTAREIIENYDGPDVRIMEVCGTHTHEIFRLGIRKLLPKQVELISGPGKMSWTGLPAIGKSSPALS